MLTLILSLKDLNKSIVADHVKILSGDNAQSIRRGEVSLLVSRSVHARAEKQNPVASLDDYTVIMVIVADSILTGGLCNVTGMPQRKLNSICSLSFEAMTSPCSLSFLISFIGEESRS